MARALKSITGTGPVVTQTKQEAAKQLAKIKGKPDLQTNTGKPVVQATKPATTTPVTPATPTVKVTSVKVMSPEEIKKEVDALLDQLRNETDGDEKKKIRRKLRLRGHYGGLGQRVSRKGAAVVDDGTVTTPPVTDIIKSPATQVVKK